MTRKKTLRERARDYFMSAPGIPDGEEGWLAGFRAAVRDARAKKRKGRKK